jgi:peptide/nickel transport system substrate-binding protein
LADGQPEWNDDFSSVKVTLKEGINWSDGEPFTADDVVFSVNMVMENPTMLYSPNLNEFTAAVVAVDDNTVRFDLKKPNPRYMLDYYGAHFFNAVRFVPEHIWKDVDDVESFKNNDPATGLPVATGPYKYVRSGETEAIWDVRDDWWGIETGFKSRPQVERVIFIPMGTPDRQIALAVNNDLDWPETFSAGPYESIFARNPEWRAFTEDRPYGYVDACPFALHINHQSGALSDPDVRKAINWSLDKAKFVNLAHEGVTPTSGPDSWLEPFIWPNLGDLPGFRDRNRDIIEKHEVELHSPERANQILEEAGYSLDSDGYRVDSNGERLKVNITWVPTGYVEFPAPVESLVNDLRAVGFDAAQKQIQFAAFGEIATGGFDLALIWVCGSTKDPYATMDGFHPKYVPDDPTERVGSFSPSRWTGSKAEQYGAAVDQMAQIHPDDIEALDPLVREAMDLWLSEMVAVPLFQYPSIKPYNQTYWKGFPTDENPYNIPYLGWQSGITIITRLEPTQ